NIVSSFFSDRAAANIYTLSLHDALPISICILMMAYCEAGDVIVHSGPLYAASEGFVAKVLSKYGVTYVDFPAGATRAELDDVLADRKSTRLNSSHVKISYAVFCLKKKII